MSKQCTDSIIEQAALAWLESLDRNVNHGPDITVGITSAERTDYGQVVQEHHLHDALARRAA